MQKRLILSLFLTIFFADASFAQTLTSTVNRGKIPLGEAFVLTVEYKGGENVGAPDFSALNQDFQVYGVSQGFQTNIVNGVSESSRQWSVTLAPKKTGKVTIPSFSTGGLQSNLVEIEVGDVTEADIKAESAAKFSISAAIDNRNPYVQQQVNYTVTLLDSGGLQGDAPQVLDDGNNNWMIRVLKEPTIESRVVNGKEIRSIKFYYALFPQKSGVLTLPTIKFDGYYFDGSGKADPVDDMFGGQIRFIGFEDMFSANRVPVSLSTKPVSVDVRPAQTKTWWIPASKLELISKWNPATPAFKQGEAVSRTIYIQAEGVMENQLPDLSFKPIDGIKQYPEKAEEKNLVKNNKVIGIKQLNNVYIINKSGEVILPEITLDWFNVATGKIEKATIPPEKINVLPSENLPAVVAAETVPAAQPIQEVKPAVKQPKNNDSKTYLIAAVAFILGLVLSYFLFRPKNSGKANYKKQVIEAAEKKNLKSLQENLLNWAVQTFPNTRIANLQDIAKAARNKEFEKELEELNRVLYSPTKTLWHAENFINSFKSAANKKRASSQDQPPLPPLY